MDTNNTTFDLIIIGGGPAGARAAFRAAGAGMKTALVEAGFLGGACLNVGCIPTKYLLGGTAALPLLAAQKKYKVASGELEFSLPALQARKDRYIKGLRQTLEKQLLEAGVSLFSGKGAFSGPQSLIVKGRDGETPLHFRKCIVATGSASAAFPGLAPDGASIFSSASLLAASTTPKSLLIVGGGAIGLEMGEIFHRLGTKITMIDAAPRILPGEDPEISEAVHAYHQREGWTIYTDRRIESLTTVNGQSELSFTGGETLHAERTLLAVGRSSTATALKPENAGIRLNARGWIVTDASLRASEHVYAAGDVNGRVLLAHAADHQARYAVKHAAGETSGEYAPPPMPSCIYGSMEVMRVGPTAHELRADTKELSVSKAPLAANAIAQSYGQPQGFVRILWKGDAIAAVSAAGHGVSHMVSAAALLTGKVMQKNESLPLIFAHPTLDEVLESAIVSTRERI